MDMSLENRIRPVPSKMPTRQQQEQMKRRFGMFIHFGVNTFANVEWSDGAFPAKDYRPSAIDAEQWVRTAYEAGMNYIIIIAKHHDGFCLWHTDTTCYGVKDSGNTTDVIAQVSRACQKYGLKLGLYYSLSDRNAPQYQSDFESQYIPYMFEQIEELLDGRYGEIAELWLDGGWEKTCAQWRLDDLYHMAKTLQPSCQIGINQTVGDHYDRAEFPSERYRPENYQYGDPLGRFPSDFRLWDPYMCKRDDPKIYTFEGQEYYMPFEMTICSRGGISWFYSDVYEQKGFLSLEETVENCKILFEQGNMAVINLPPNTDGRLTEGDISQLMQIADGLGIRRKPVAIHTEFIEKELVM